MVLLGKTALAAPADLLLSALVHRRSPLDWLDCSGRRRASAGGLWLARGRIGRGPLVAILFFGGTLLPALGFVNVYPMRYSFVADHFQYLASLGPIVLAVGGATAIFSRWLRGLWSSPGWLAVLLVLGATTWHQQASYRDAESLWSWTYWQRIPPASWLIFTWGRCVPLKAVIRKPPTILAALALETDDSESHIDFTNLGMSLARQGKFVEARDCLNEAVRRGPGRLGSHS